MNERVQVMLIVPEIANSRSRSAAFDRRPIVCVRSRSTFKLKNPERHVRIINKLAKVMNYTDVAY